ncbi:flagellar basal body-associated FliL family protein [Vibrio sp.]|uniref:flagellar basal body-associated FliL family protein n=1 Tax=Vibrio sp. TaxID=678 RepID=UPI003D115D58
MNKQPFIAMLMLAIVTSALVSALTVVGGVWYLQQSQQDDGKGLFSGSALSFLSQPEASNRPSFHSLEKLVLSVKGKKMTHFVMLELAVETRNPEGIKDIDDYMPVVRNSLVKLFSNKHYEQLQGEGAVESLQNEVKQTILQAFAKTDLVRDIDDVLLTKYVVQ